ncbi:MAG: Clp protease N-terminal domain-containing protein [Planctomycetota bacterium]|jgi:ATP-dependent Clp protease ATP-binding subunit ClpA
MHERFSDRARHAMALANQEAGRLNHNYLIPAHLMLGLIAEGACVATETLRLLDVDLNKVRDEVHEKLKGMEKRDSAGARAQSKELKEVIALAIKEAREHNHRYVGTEHLIVGLLSHTNSIPAQVLASQNLQVDSVREKALEVLRSTGEPANDLTHSRHGDFEWVHQQELAKAFRSQKFWHTMILAVDAANRLGDGEIAPKHLLLALLRDSDGQTSTMLLKKGITTDWVKENFA